MMNSNVENLEFLPDTPTPDFFFFFNICGFRKLAEDVKCLFSIFFDLVQIYILRVIQYIWRRNAACSHTRRTRKFEMQPLKSFTMKTDADHFTLI